MSPQINLSYSHIPNLKSVAHPRVVSPDGRYVAVMTMPDAEVGEVAVYARGAAKPKVLVRFDNADDYIWVPYHGHLLLVATGGGDFGEGMLAAWNSGRHFRYLRRAKHPEDEGYIIKGVTANGRSVVYEHFTGDVQHGETHKLRLQ